VVNGYSRLRCYDCLHPIDLEPLSKLREIVTILENFVQTFFIMPKLPCPCANLDKKVCVPLNSTV
jgi:hypothetical protein